MILKGKKVFLRSTFFDDADHLYIWENDKANWNVSGTKKPFTKKQIKDFILNQTDIYLDKQLRLMICLPSRANKIEGLTIGCIDLFHFDERARKAGIGVLIEKKYRKKGYASDALALLIKYSFKTLNLRELYCNVAEENKASMQLFKKCKFKISDKKKNICSLHLMSKNR